MKEYVSEQIKKQTGNNGSADKLLEMIYENMDGKFSLTEETIDRLCAAYKDFYKGIMK